jgi:rhodanese-related sulfurtransferase
MDDQPNKRTKDEYSMARQATREALILILIAVTAAFAVYAIRPDKIGDRPASVTGDAGAGQSTEGAFSEISIEEAVRLYRDHRAIFADARHRADFESGHIKGAIHLYAEDQDTWLPEFLAANDPAATIVTYCDGENCHLAPALAEILFFNGFDHVRYLKNGWTRWREGGFPVE